jgi:hypothetical protein
MLDFAESVDLALDLRATPGPETPFEIGLVMAGAISAGAYTAGVIDFLIDALDAWEQAKADAAANPAVPASSECPTHKVLIKVMSGASAGGMTAGLATGLLGMKYDSVQRQPATDAPAHPKNNNLYRSWVNTIDIDPLLGLNDLDQAGGQPVQSMLDSSILQTIATDAFQFDQPAARVSRPFIADQLHVLLTVTNLRGVPYAPTFADRQKIQQYEMTMHADNVHFILSPTDPGDPSAFWLKPYDFANTNTWGVLQKAALATGAFPVGLAPRMLSRPPSQYDSRQWLLPSADGYGPKGSVASWVTIPPNWPAIKQAAELAAKAGKPFMYDFLCVDGGVMNNEPLDLARYYLIGPAADEPKDGASVTHAVIMVLPFPNAAPYPVEYSGESNLLANVIATFSSLIDQARFNPQEILSAQNADIYSRFLIVPRSGFLPDGSPQPNTIASGSLEGFGGFLSRKFREHDYQLGRRNCQQFLKEYFALPSEGDNRNKLFDGWTNQARARFKMPAADGKNVAHLPIIPLVGKAAVEVPQPQWPKMSQSEFNALRPKIEKRLNRVLDALVAQNIQGFFWGPVARGALKAAWWAKKNSAVDSIMSAIQQDLTQRSLL